MDMILEGVLNALQQVVLKVINSDEGKVVHIAGDSEWLTDFFPQMHDKSSPFIIDEQTPFLQDFLIDARDIWQGGIDTKLKSGFWTEVTSTQKELHLEATAIRHGTNNILIINSLSEEFKERQQTLQVAREVFLSNDDLIEQNDYLHTRLLSMLKKSQQQASVLPLLTKAIEKAEFSVIIADNAFKTLIDNSATYTLFNKNKDLSIEIEKPIEIIINLMKSQLPEFERIISTKSSWDGELCWICPPSTLKWLKIALYPVKNEFNEVKNWIIFTNDITNAKHFIQKSEQLAIQDMLTDLPNRYAFWQTLEQLINKQTPFYLLYLDINKFRSHNEYYGHDGGDKLLIDLSKRISTILKNSDYIARVGGDQFAIVLPNLVSQSECEIIIDKILASSSLPFFTEQQDSFQITLSVGATSYPNDAVNVEELMKFVDLSAYTGKSKNKNTVQFYSNSIKEASLQVIEIEKELRDAIENQEFELYLQPIVNIDQSSIQKAEALIRWNHPKKGLISPDTFIPTAEKSDLINAIGRWVIESACRMVKKLNNEGYQIQISINLSPPQVLEENLFNFIHDNIKKYEISPELLELEFTEGVLLNDYKIAEKLLSQTRAIGMSVSIDDFGTGYSSLAYLKKLPLDKLKIDRSFIKDIVKDDNDKAIVRAVISMAHNLNLSVTAEGVETENQLTFLRDNQCNSAQGYLYSRPVSYSKFVELIKNF